MTSEAFFQQVGEDGGGLVFEATQHSRGPWDPRAQHGGPPSALIAHVMDRSFPRPDLRTVRMTMELLRPVPVGVLRVEAEVLRGGKKVEYLSAAMTAVETGDVVMTARSWRIRVADVDLGVGVDGAALAGPEEAYETAGFFRFAEPGGYVDSMETRFLAGDWAVPGPATAWFRMRYPLVAGHEPSPLERVLIAADCGNGISSRFDGIFINPDLTVYLVRPPTDEWVCLDAVTTLTDDGVGMAASVLHDRLGPIGRASQALLLDSARPPS